MTNSNGQHYVPSSKIRSAADIERAAAGVIDVDAKTTTYVVLACVIAASGGVLFGYDGGVTGDHNTDVLIIGSLQVAREALHQLSRCSLTLYICRRRCGVHDSVQAVVLSWRGEQQFLLQIQ